MRKFLLLIVLLSCWSVLMAQERTVTGTVSDVNGHPVVGATVVVKGTTIGTTTDNGGAFSIGLPSAGGQTLTVSFLGMSSRDVAVGAENNVDVVLTDEGQDLEQIVVVGYGTVRKSDLTGSVESVKGDKLTLGAATNAAQMLQGRVAGLYINSHNQDPGAVNDIMLRGVGSLAGSTQPLIVVDGFPTDDASILNTINPNDIEQMDILKDASATAIYGSRGANGVIIVTTKSGRSGELRIEYGGKFSMERLAREVDMMNSDEYIRFYYDLAHDPYFSYSFPEGYEGNNYPYLLEAIGTTADTNWQKELTNRNRLTHNHNLAVSGGAEYLNYRASVSYYDGRGLVGPYNYQRFNTASKINYKKNRLSFTFDIAFTKENTNRVRNEYVNAVRFPSTVGKFDEDGNLSKFPVKSMDYYENPFYNQYNIEDFTETNTTRLGYNVGYEVLPGLKVEGRVGYERRFYENYQYENEKNSSKDEGGIRHNNRQNINVDGIISYVKTFGQKHNFSVMAAGNTQQIRYRGNKMDGKGFTSPLIKYYQMSDVLDKLLTNIESEWKENSLMSFLARLTYDYDKRYYLTVNYRRDGATQFGDEHKWGDFPSVAVAWKIDNEKFFRADYFNNLKLKVGYGLSGNASVPSGRSQSLIEYMPVYLGGSVQNGVTWKGGYIPNPELRWEGSRTINGGFEVGTRHFSFDFNAYRKYSYDLLIERPVPVELGYEKITVNKGELLNVGVEAKADGYLRFLSGQLYWNPSAWFAFNKNDLRNFDGSVVNTLSIWDRSNFYGYGGRMMEGFPMGAIFGYDYIGVWQENEAAEAAVYGARPGDPKFKDRNTSDASGNEIVAAGPDGKIDEADKRYLGSSYPKVTLGFSNTLTYKKWSLSFMFDGVINKKVVNYNRVGLMNPNNIRYSNLSREVLKRWTPDHPDTNIPSFTRDLDARLITSTFAVEDATFFRLSEVTLSFTHDFKKNNTIKGLRAYITGTNLATMTNYTGLNPDVMGYDLTWNLYPITRSFILGINLTF